MVPDPARMRTRAGACVIDDQRLGQLALVRMGRPGVHLELAELLATETVVGEHAADRPADRLFGLVGQQVGVGPRRQTTGVSRVAVDELVLGLARGQDDLGRVDDDDVVAGVEVRGEDRLVLAAQEASDLGGETPEDHALGVDDMPVADDL